MHLGNRPAIGHRIPFGLEIQILRNLVKDLRERPSGANSGEIEKALMTAESISKWRNEPLH
jgi:hypothetical protein